jgi:anti-sigma factor RsiW
VKPRFDELLPFYANGTLSPADREWVETYLREHPSAQAELQWYESLRTHLR